MPIRSRKYGPVFFDANCHILTGQPVYALLKEMPTFRRALLRLIIINNRQCTEKANDSLYTRTAPPISRRSAHRRL